MYESVYADVIKPTLASVNVEAVISKDVKGIEWPFKKIHTAIHESRFCIADISELNENVMYEVGYASALEKKTILIWDTSKRQKNPAFDVNYFHGEPYHSEEKTWSAKLAHTLKGHFEAEMKKPSSKANSPVLENFALDDFGLQVITALAAAESNQQSIGVVGMLNLMTSLGHERLQTSLGLDSLVKNRFIGRTHNAYGDEFCDYCNESKAKEFLRQNGNRMLVAHQMLPDNFGEYASHDVRF